MATRRAGSGKAATGWAGDAGRGAIGANDTFVSCARSPPRASRRARVQRSGGGLSAQRYAIGSRKTCGVTGTHRFKTAARVPHKRVMLCLRTTNSGALAVLMMPRNANTTGTQGGVATSGLAHDGCNLWCGSRADFPFPCLSHTSTSPSSEVPENLLLSGSACVRWLGWYTRTCHVWWLQHPI